MAPQGETMETTTFDNISSSEPISEGPLETPDQTPDTPAPEAQIETKEQPLGINNPLDITATPEVKQEKPVQPLVQDPIIKLGQDAINLKELVSNPQKLGELQKTLENGVMMRADYSRKTAELARDREAYAKDKAETQQQLQQHFSQMDYEFNTTPLLFLQNTFKYDEKGQVRSPEQMTQQINGWLDNLTNEIEMGSKYNPGQMRRQHELEQRLKQLEHGERTKAQVESQQREEQAITQVQSHLEKKIMDSLPKESQLNAFDQVLPGFKDFFVQKVLSEFEELFNKSYNPQDKNWDDFKFIDSYDFSKAWGNVDNIFKQSYDKNYTNYLERKKADSSKKTTKAGSAIGKPASAKGTTFDELFGWAKA